MRVVRTFQPGSGTAEFNFLNVDASINQTSAVSGGVTRGLLIGINTFTDVRDFRALEIQNINAAHYAIRTGIGKVAFGDNVGIGTDSPNGQLNIHGGSGSTAYIHFNTDATGDTTNDGMTVGYNNGGVISVRENLPLLFSTNDVSRWEIEADGDLMPRVTDTYDIGKGSNTVNNISQSGSLVNYNTFTDASNYERSLLIWSSNVLQLKTQAIGTGVDREIEIAGKTLNVNSRNSNLVRFQYNDIDYWNLTTTNFTSVGNLDLGDSTTGRLGTVYGTDGDFSGSVGVGLTAGGSNTFEVQDGAITYAVSHTNVTASAEVRSQSNAKLLLRDITGNGNYPTLEYLVGQNADPPNTGQALGRVTFSGAFGVDSFRSAFIEGRLVGALSATSSAGSLGFFTTPTGSTTPIERLLIHEDGEFEFSGDLRATGDLVLRDGANPKLIDIYNTYTDSSNYERGFVRWDSSRFQIGTEDLGTGSPRHIAFLPAGTETFRLASGGTVRVANAIYFGSVATDTGEGISQTSGALHLFSDGSIVANINDDNDFAGRSFSVQANAAWPGATTVFSVEADGTGGEILGAFAISGGISLNVETFTSTDTLDANNHVCLCDTTSGFTLNLPAAASHTGRIYQIKKTSADGNAVTIDGSGAETIDGSLTIILTTQFESITIVSDGSNWFIT